MLFDLQGLKRASRCVLDFATLPCLESRSLYIPFSSKLWKSVVAHTICISHGCSSNSQTIRGPCRKYGRGKLIPVFNPTHQRQTSVLEHRFSNIRKWRRLAPWRCSLNNRCHPSCLPLIYCLPHWVRNMAWHHWYFLLVGLNVLDNFLLGQ